MKFTVTWLPGAEAKLTVIWNQATDKQAVADAADQIDRILHRDAERKGKPLGKFRKLTVAPLSVLFIVSPDDRMVIVVDVKRV
jgi:hypothetical protein